MKIFRSQKYRSWVATHQCLACGFGPCDPHHEPLGENMTGNKPPDSFCTPLCRECHNLRHARGPSFWTEINRDPKMEIIKLLTRWLMMKGGKNGF